MPQLKPMIFKPHCLTKHLYIIEQLLNLEMFTNGKTEILVLLNYRKINKYHQLKKNTVVIVVVWEPKDGQLLKYSWSLAIQKFFCA